MSFGMQVCFDYGMLIFGKLGSKVKVKYPWKYAFSGPILVEGAMCRAIQDQGESGWVPLAACQLILAICQKLDNDGRPPPDRFPSTGKLPV